MVRPVVVVPTVREDSIRKFLELWTEEFQGCRVIVIEDNPTRTFRLTHKTIEISHFSWEEIDAELGSSSWIIPRRTDCVRSFGFLKACVDSPDLIITLDDDCYPDEAGFIEAHWSKLVNPASSPAWVETGEGFKTRGVPFFNLSRESECVINHGLWKKVPDLDAVTQLTSEGQRKFFAPTEKVIPRGQFFSMCGMNLAFKPKIVPALYFLLMGTDRFGQQIGVDRFGDIWAGILAKKICDHLGFSITSGRPFVNHERASDVWVNLRKEASGYELNESFWSAVDELTLSGTNILDCYREIALKLPLDTDYFSRLREAMTIWVSLFA